MPCPILLITTSLRGHGGAEKDMRACLAHWQRQGRQVDVISAFPDPTLVEELRAQGAWVHRIRLMPRPTVLFQVRFSNRAQMLAKQWKQRHPEGRVVCFERLPGAEMYGGFLPYRLWWEGRKAAGFAIWNRPALRLWERWSEARILSTAHEIAVYSEAARKALEAAGFPAKRIRRVIIPRNLEFFHPPRGGNAPRELLFIGSAYRMKGADLVLAAWDRHLRKALPDFRLRIVCKPQSSTARAAKGVEGVLVSSPVDDPREYYWRAALLLAPSVMESWGNVVVEALACGMPVITTTATPASEVIQDHVAGYVFSRSARLDRDARMLSELALRTLRDPNQWDPSLRTTRWSIVQSFQERHDSLFAWAEGL